MRPEKDYRLERSTAHCTPQQARAGLAESAARYAEMLAEALGGGGDRWTSFAGTAGLDLCPAGAEMLCYMHSHEAYHRGAGLYARVSARIPVADQGDVRHLEWGKAVERVRVAWRPGCDS